MSSQPEKPEQTQQDPDPTNIRSKSKSDDNTVFLSNPDLPEGTKLPETPRNRKASGESILLNFKPGDEVCFTNIKTGDTQTVTIKWKGIVQADIHAKRPLMYGIEFKTPIGKHAGRGLFRCRPNHGSLVLPKSLSKIEQTDKPSKRLRHDSGSNTKIPIFKKKVDKFVKPVVKSSVVKSSVVKSSVVKSSIPVKIVQKPAKTEKLNIKKLPEQKSRESRPKSATKSTTKTGTKTPKSKENNKPKIDTPGKNLKLITEKPDQKIDVENEIIAKLNFLDIGEIKKQQISNPKHLVVPTAPKNERKSKSPSRLNPDEIQLEEKENRMSLVFEKQNSETAIHNQQNNQQNNQQKNQQNNPQNRNFRPAARPNSENRLRMPPRRSRSVPRKILEKPVAKSKESQDLEESMLKMSLTKSQKRHQIYSSKLFTPDHKYKTDREFATGLPFKRNTPQKKVYRKTKPKNLEIVGPEIVLENAI